MPAAIVIGIGSDIGRELSLRLVADGWTVSGTYRTAPRSGEFQADIDLVRCDLAEPSSVESALGGLRSSRAAHWDLLIVAAGTEEPVGKFWDCDANEWEVGIRVNALAPLRLVRGLYGSRNVAASPSVAFFSGAGTNSAAPAYSAYSASKIFLIKMCELLDAESEDTSFFIIGPGIVRTKIHEQTLRAKSRSGANHKKVVDFLQSPDPGTSHDDIYACLRWCADAGKPVIGGRNISLVHDSWRNMGGALASLLEGDPNLYKLRRFGNDLCVAIKAKNLSGAD